MKTLNLIVLIASLVIMMAAMLRQSTDAVICAVCLAIITKLDMLESDNNG